MCSYCRPLTEGAGTRREEVRKQAAGGSGAVAEEAEEPERAAKSTQSAHPSADRAHLQHFRSKAAEMSPSDSSSDFGANVWKYCTVEKQPLELLISKKKKLNLQTRVSKLKVGVT